MKSKLLIRPLLVVLFLGYALIILAVCALLLVCVAADRLRDAVEYLNTRGLCPVFHWLRNLWQQTK
ncbi:MAG: hypothetical protein LBK76_02505 [Verrucomicrobiales bacterium]|jgi:hypothetical protein|nr:hypothetical protein [Verrucomicrobiales bacterium]